jgi:predicted RNA-binding protein with PIN domain
MLHEDINLQPSNVQMDLGDKQRLLKTGNLPVQLGIVHLGPLLEDRSYTNPLATAIPEGPNALRCPPAPVRGLGASMARIRTWIMDGHNMIFTISQLQRLQVSGLRDEARRGLVDRLRRFALTRGEKVLVVFDGNDLQWNPDVIREPLLEVVYTRRSDGEADDRIIHEARLCLEQGHHATVVSNDFRTLVKGLPEGVQHLEVQAFWLKYIQKAVGRMSKPVEGDFSDVESEMEARAAQAKLEPLVHNPVLLPQASALHPAAGSTSQGQTGVRPVPSFMAGTPGRSPEEEAMRERIQRKRERGRLRQERRLERHPKPGRCR